MTTKLIDEVYERYSVLRNLSPNHELLRYFVQTDEVFKMNEDIETAVEFMDRFRTGAPDLEQLKNNKKKIDFTEYQQDLSSAVFGNYLSALEQAVINIISRN